MVFMKISAGKYLVNVPLKIYRMGDSHPESCRVVYWMNFINGKEFNLCTEEHMITSLEFDFDIEIDPEKKIINFY